MTELLIEYLKSEYPNTILRKRHNAELNAAFNIAEGIIRQQTKMVIIDTDKIVTKCLSQTNDPVTFKRIHDNLYEIIIKEYIETHPNVYGLVFVCDQTKQSAPTRSDVSGAMSTDPEVFGMMTNSVTHDALDAWRDMRMRPWNLTAIMQPVLARIATYMATEKRNAVITTTFMLHNYKTKKAFENKWIVKNGTVAESFLESVVVQYPSAITQTIRIITSFKGSEANKFPLAMSVYTDNKNMVTALVMRDLEAKEVALYIGDAIFSINGIKESMKKEGIKSTIERICLVDEYITSSAIPRMRSDAIKLIKNASIDIKAFATDSYDEVVEERDGKTTTTMIKNLILPKFVVMVELMYQARFFWGKVFAAIGTDALDIRIAEEFQKFAIDTNGMKIDHIKTLFPEWYDELKRRLSEFESNNDYMCVSLLFQHMFIQQQILKDTCKINWESDNVMRLMKNKGRRYIIPVTVESKKDLYEACQEAKSVDAERMDWDYGITKPLTTSEYADNETYLFDGTLSSSHDVCEYALPFIKIDTREKLYVIIKRKLALFKTLMENSYLSYLLFRREYDLIYRGKQFEFSAENLVKITDSNSVLSEQPLFATFIFAWLHHKNISVAAMQRAKNSTDEEEVYRKIKTTIAESRETLETVHSTFPSAHNLRFAITSQRVMLFFANWPRTAILAYIKQSIVNKENVKEMYKGLLFIDKKTMPVVFYDVSFPLDSAQYNPITI